MRVWVVEQEDHGVEGVYTDPEAAALDAGTPLDQWEYDATNDSYEISNRDRVLYSWEVLDSAGVVAAKEREAAEEEERRATERARQWIK